MLEQGGPIKSERKLWSLKDSVSEKDLRVIREFDAKAVLSLISLLCITALVGIATIIYRPDIAAWAMLIMILIGLLLLLFMGARLYKRINKSSRYKSSFLVDNKKEIPKKAIYGLLALTSH